MRRRPAGYSPSMRTTGTRPVAQVLFVTVDEPRIRFDVVLMDATSWEGRQLPAGTPISISFDIDQPIHQSPVTSMARAWAAALAPIQLTFNEDEGRQLVVMAAGDEQLVLSMAPSR